MRLLLIEDAPRLRAMLLEALTRMGHAVDAAPDGLEGEAMARTAAYDVVILDRMLPGKDGLAVLSDLRRGGFTTPVLLLTALDAIDERVRGLNTGADDYLPKPFALAELAARLEALGRRHHGRADSVLRLGSMEIDLAARRLTCAGVVVDLTAREFSLLECLARHPGHVLSRAQIEEQVYAGELSPLSNAVDTAICSLRRKISDNGGPPVIHTRRGLGYVLELS